MRDIIRCFGRQGEHMPRLRVGVGKASCAKVPARASPSFVLGQFNGQERATANQVKKFAAEVIRVWLFRGIEAATQVANSCEIVESESDDDNRDYLAVD